MHTVTRNTCNCSDNAPRALSSWLFFSSLSSQKNTSSIVLKCDIDSVTKIETQMDCVVISKLYDNSRRK